MSHIRVESHEKVVKNAKVFFVDGDEEVDISSCVQGVTLDLQVGELATATLRVIVGHSDVSARVEELLVSRVTPVSWWRRVFLRQGPHEITTVSDQVRRWS